MIVVDTNVLAYLFLPCEYTEQATSLFEKDQTWVAPILWRSEFRNVLALYMRKGVIDLTKSLQIQEEAESLLAEGEYEVPSMAVLSQAQQTGCSAYDCEFIVLAQQLGVLLVTEDKKILESAPNIAVSMDVFLTRGR